jgi:hypothetical protein
MDLDTNGGIPKIHLVAASVTSPDDCAWQHDPPEISAGLKLLRRPDDATDDVDLVGGTLVGLVLRVD